LANAKALLERVSAVQVKEQEHPLIGPLATPALVKQVAESWH